MKPLRLAVLALLAFAAVLPTQAQTPTPTWCRLFDFTQGQQGWEISSDLEEVLGHPYRRYGRYTPGSGFTVTNYTGNNTGSEWFVGQIRIHRDFSATITQLAVIAQGPDYSHIIVKFDGEYTGSSNTEGSPYVPTAIGVTPMVIGFSEKQVTGRLGLAFIKDIAIEWPQKTIITGIAISGVGPNPFGPGDCNQQIRGHFDEIGEFTQGANDLINSLPVDLTRPEGQPILPSFDDLIVFFGYVKWLISPTTGSELFGPFAPVFQHLAIGFGAIMVLAGVYVVSYIAVWLITMARWLFTWVLRMIDLALQVIQAGVQLFLKGASAVIGFLGL